PQPAPISDPPPPLPDALPIYGPPERRYPGPRVPPGLSRRALLGTPRPRDLARPHRGSDATTPEPGRPGDVPAGLALQGRGHGGGAPGRLDHPVRFTALPEDVDVRGPRLPQRGGSGPRRPHAPGSDSVVL